MYEASTGTVVDSKLIFVVALKARASGIILSPNHQATAGDLQLTRKMKSGGKRSLVFVLVPSANIGLLSRHQLQSYKVWQNPTCYYNIKACRSQAKLNVLRELLS